MKKPSCRQKKITVTVLQHDNQVNASFRPNPAVCVGGLNGSDCFLPLTKQEDSRRPRGANRRSQTPQTLVNVAIVANTPALSACDARLGLRDLVAGFQHENTRAARVLMIHLPFWLRAGDPAAMINVGLQCVVLTRRATASQSSRYRPEEAGSAVM